MGKLTAGASLRQGQDDPYLVHKADIARENAYLLKRVSICACVNMTALTVLSPFLNGFDASFTLYLTSAILTGAFSLFCHFWLEKNLRWVTPFFYLLLAGLCAYAIILSSFYYPFIHGVTIVGVYVLIPMVILDKAWRQHLIFLLFFAASCLFAFANKPLDLAVDDTITTGAFMVFGQLIGGYLRNVRLKAIIQQRQLEFQRDIDSLTNLPNRRLLFRTLGEIDASGNGRSLAGIFMADLDDFKSYNDYQGHQAGDDFLAGLGELFTRFAQENNITIYRYGGEEFLGLVLKEAGRDVGRLSVALVDLVREENIRGSQLTLSIGYAFQDEQDSVSSERLISMADNALYQAKDQGRDRAVGYEPSMSGGFSHRVRNRL